MSSLISTYKVDKTPDHIYYNVSVNNNVNAYLPFNFKQTLNQDFIANPREYEASIVRFFVPGDGLPIYNFKVRNTADNGTPIILGPNDLGIGVYAFTIIYNNSGTITNYVFPMLYIRDDLYSTSANGNYFVNNYQTNLAMINEALSNVYDLFKVGVPSATQSKPYLSLDTYAGSLTLNNLTGWNTTAFPAYPLPPANGEAQLWINSDLNRFLGGFSSYSALNAYSTTFNYNGGGANYSITYSADVRIMTEYAKIPQLYGINVSGASAWLITELNPLSDWNDALSLVFTSSNLSIVNESIPQTSTIITSNPIISTTSTSSLNDAKQIINDFIIGSDTGTDAFTNLVYNPTAEYRIFNLASDNPIRILDFQLYWLDIYGKYNIYYLPPQRGVSLKLMFRKKK